MKTKRFFSFFLILALALVLCLPVAAAGTDSEAVLPEDPNILAKAALLIDLETGAVAYAKNEHQELYPASLTKIMTALLVLEAVDEGKITMEQELTASSSALSGLPYDGSNAGIKVGEIMSVQNLLYCMLVVSANEACNILAEGVSGSIGAFVEKMNARAAELGCVNTHFVNTNGLHDPQHYTSAWDIYLITQEALTHTDFMTICNTANVVIPATNMSSARNYWTTNHLLATWRVIGYRNREAMGIKTGSTSDAGYCLVSSAARGSLHFLSVILGAERVEENGVGNIRSFSETTRMFNYGFDNFTYKTIIEKQEPIQEISVSLSEMDHVTVHPARSIEVLIPKGLEPEHLERTVTLYADPVEAPVAEGAVLGTLTLHYDGVEYGTVELLASHNVEASQKLIFYRDVQAFFSNRTVHIVAVAVVILILLIILLVVIFGRSRRRYGRSSMRRGHSGYRGRKRR